MQTQAYICNQQWHHHAPTSTHLGVLAGLVPGELGRGGGGSRPLQVGHCSRLAGCMLQEVRAGGSVRSVSMRHTVCSSKLAMQSQIWRAVQIRNTRAWIRNTVGIMSRLMMIHRHRQQALTLVSCALAKNTAQQRAATANSSAPERFMVITM
jgi:hypothetical protein